MDLWHAEAAHRPADGQVGVDRTRITFHVRNVVWAGARVAGSAGDVDAVIVIGAAAKVVLGFHRQQVALGIAADLGVCHQALAHRRADELLLARQTQLDRMPLDRPRQDQRARLHRHARLATEPAADVGRHHTQVAVWDVQTLGEQVTLSVGRLRTGPQRDLPRFLPEGHRYVRLERHVLDLGQAEGPLHDGIAPGPGGLDVPFAEFEVLRDVGARFGEDEVGHFVFAQVRVEQRGIRLEGFQRAEHRRQFFVLHLNESSRLLCDPFAGRNNPGDRLPKVPHALASQDGAIYEVHANQLRSVLAGDNCLHSRHLQCLARVYVFDQGVGVGTPGQPGVVKVRTELYVVGKDGSPGDLIVRIHAGEALANRIRGELGHFASPLKIPAPVLGASFAAVCTAWMKRR